MAADATRCPSCGAERPANAPEGPCSACLTRQAPTADRLAPADVDATMARTISGPADSGEATQAGPEPADACPGDVPDLQDQRSRDPADKSDWISVDQFLGAVEDLGLMDGADARAFLTKIAKSRPSCDSQELGRELVAAGRLTGYQVGAICQGKAKGLVIGRYIVLDKLGAGGMGMVFKAQHRRLKQVFALKIMPPSLTRNPELVQRFHREAETAAKLNHPNIVRAIDADDAGGTHFLVMEFVEGTNLSKLVRDAGSPVAGEGTRRDDPGRAGARGRPRRRDRAPRHQALEPDDRCRRGREDPRPGPRPADRRAFARWRRDHALGLLDGDGRLYVSGTGVRPPPWPTPDPTSTASAARSISCSRASAPYRGDSLMQRLLAHREKPVPSLRSRRPDVPAALDELFREMVAKYPKDRPGLDGQGSSIGSKPARPPRRPPRRKSPPAHGIRRGRAYRSADDTICRGPDRPAVAR